MMIPRLVKRLGTACALALLLIGASANDAFASHFRYGQITWRVPNPAQKNVVEFRFEMAFRRSFFSPAPTIGPPATQQNVGPFSVQRIDAAGNILQTLVTQDLILTTTQVFAADDAWIGVFTYTYAFPNNTAATRYQLYYTGCCRISTIVDANHDQNYNILTKFTLDTTAGGFVNGSPVSSSVPVVYGVRGVPINHIIPTADYNNDPVTVRLATSAESSLPITAPAGAPSYTVASNGTVTWTPTTVGLYSVQVVLTDTHGASSVLDFLYQIVPQVGSFPTLEINGATTPQTLRVPVGYAVTVPIRAKDPDPLAPITISSGFLPTNSTMTPSLPATLVPAGVNQYVTTTFRWTPTVADIGPKVFIFTATDNNLQQRNNSLTIIVDPAIGLYINGIIRDFSSGSDFARADGDNAPTRIVATTLGANSKPVYQPVNTVNGQPTGTTTVASAASFASWWSGAGQSLALGLNASPSNPNVYSFNTASFAQPGHTYFTYEAHTFYTYGAGDVLSFSSSDDLWIFLNGRLVVDLGGVHTAVRSATLSLDNIAAANGLAPGNTYRMDIFYAHRGASHGASIGLETTEVAFCDPVSDPVATTLPSRAGTAFLNGDGSTRLVASVQPNLLGAAWTGSRLPVAAGFAAEFDFNITNASGEGFAFVLQDSLPLAIGGAAGNGNLGYSGIPKSLAVEFDAHQDPPLSDPAYDSVSIHTAFAAANSAAETFSLGASGSGLAGDLNNGLTRHALITYAPDPQGTMFLRVYLDNAAAVAVEVPVTNAQIQQAFASGVAYVGFTSNNDNALLANVTISNFKFGSAEASPALSTLQVPPAPQLPDTTGFVTVLARTACNVPMTFGGMDLQATMKTDDYTTGVSVTDNSDGTYTLSFTPRVGGPWQLAVTSDGTGIRNSPFTVPVSPATPTLTVTGGTFPYTGGSPTGTGSAKGVFDEDLGGLHFTYNGADSAIDAGTYTLVGIFDGSSHYASASLEAATPLVITPVDPTVHVNDSTVTYDRQPHHATGTATGVLGEDLGALSFTYDGSSTAPTNAHTYVVVGSYAASTNYNALSDTGSLEITKAVPVVHVNGATHTFSALAHPATGNVTGVDDEDLGAVATFLYDPGPNAPINAGAYQATGVYAGSDNYVAAQGEGTITIERALPAVHVNNLSFTYDAQAHHATGSVTGVNDEVIGSPTSFTYQPGGPAPINAGSYDVAAAFAGNGNYLPASGVGTLTIGVATPIVHVDTLSFTYDGTPHAATGTVTGVNNELLSPLAFTYNGDGAAPVNSGSYVVVGRFAASGNYGDASGNGALTIGKATPPIAWATPAWIVYGTPLSGAQLNATAGPAGSFTYSPEAGTVLHAGARTLSVTFAPADADNYDPATAEVTLDVSPAPLTIRANNANKAYGAALPALSASGIGFVNGDTLASLSTPATVTTSATAASSAGAYPISASNAASADYDITFEGGTLTVTAVPLTIRANDASKTYGAALPAFSAAGEGFVNGDTLASLTTPPVASTGATSASPAGSYSITVNGATSANYTITFADGTLTVGAAPLTIRANNASKIYGAVLPAFSASGEGFVNGDTLASLATQPVLSTAATTASPAGAYAINAAGATSPNYAIAFAGGTLTVGAAPLTIRANDASKVYGAAIPALSASGEGFVNGDTLASLTTAPMLSTTATPASNVGSYPIAVGGATSANYAISFAGATLTVNRAPLTITADNKAMIQGFPVPPLTASYSGFVNGDNVASLDSPVALSTTGTPASGAGSYPIVPSGAADANYTIGFVNGALTINASYRAGIALTRDALAALVPGANPATAALLNKAIGRINDALDPSLWTDATHASSQGQKMFESLRQALGELNKISSPPAAVAAAIQRLLDIARQMVTDSITAAQAAGRGVAQAQSFLADGDARRSAGDPDGAMQRYKQAWQAAN